MNDLVILAALLRAPAYGYALQKTAGLTYGKALHPNIVYPLLKKFVQNEWVEQSSTPGERGQTRKQYRITAAGKKHMVQELSNFSEHNAGDRNAFLFRVANFDALSKAKRRQILNTRKRFLDERVQELAALAQHVKPESFGRITLDRVQALVRDEMRWIRKLEDHMELKN